MLSCDKKIYRFFIAVNTSDGTLLGHEVDVTNDNERSRKNNIDIHDMVPWKDGVSMWVYVEHEK